MENVSCEDLEKMSARNVRDLKRARQFALPKISKQHSPRDESINAMKSGRANKFFEQSNHQTHSVRNPGFTQVDLRVIRGQKVNKSVM